MQAVEDRVKFFAHLLQLISVPSSKRAIVKARGIEPPFNKNILRYVTQLPAMSQVPKVTYINCKVLKIDTLFQPLFSSKQVDLVGPSSSSRCIKSYHCRLWSTACVEGFTFAYQSPWTQWPAIVPHGTLNLIHRRDHEDHHTPVFTGESIPECAETQNVLRTFTTFRQE